MAIDSLDALVDAMANNRQKIPFTKTSNIGTQVVGGSSSFFRIAGFPAAGLGFGSVETFDNTSTGVIPFTNPTGGMKTHIAKIAVSAGGAGSYEIHDRLAQSQSLSGTSTSLQSISGLDLATLAATKNIGERKGRSDYAAVQWWLEWATATGSTAVTATIAYTDQNGTARTTTVAIPASTAAGRMIQIIPNAEQYIKGITGVTLSATTGTVGSFGVVATLQRTELFTAVANQQVVFDWAALGLPVIYDSSALFFIAITSAVTVQAPSGAITLVQG